MKLLYVANVRIPTPRAYGLQIMKTCEAFAQANVQVELCTPTRNAKESVGPFEFYGVKELFRFVTLRTPDLLSFGPVGFFVSALWFAEMVRWTRSFRDADIIYSRDAFILLNYLFLGRRLVYEAHARPTFFSTRIARSADLVVVISRGLKEAYEAVGVKASHIVVAPDAVDENLFAGVPERDLARQAVALPSDKKVVLYAGHLYPRKGAEVLAEAASLIPEVLFVFVGGTPEDVTVFKNRWGKTTNVRILGYKPHETIPLYMRSADIVVLPNSGTDEDSARFTSPMKLFEYIASGTPLIASDLPSMREVLDTTSAYFVRPDNPEELATGVREVLADVQVSSERALQAQKLSHLYSWKKRAENILARVTGEGYHARNKSS